MTKDFIAVMSLESLALLPVEAIYLFTTLKMFRVINVVLTVYITYSICFNVDQRFDIYILYELFKKDEF